MGKSLGSPAFFRPISLTSCVSKLFERIILSRLLFFLEFNSILSPRQAGFRPGRSTLDEILYLSQSISDGFNKPRPGSRTILSTIDFSKAVVLKLFQSRPPWHLSFMLTPHLASKIKFMKNRTIIYLPLSCLVWRMQLFFLETSHLIRGFVEDNAHRRSASHSSLLRNFVFILTSAENPLSHKYVDENGRRVRIAALPTFLYICKYLAQKLLRGIASKSSLALELHFISKNSSCSSFERISSLIRKGFLVIFHSFSSTLPKSGK